MWTNGQKSAVFHLPNEKADLFSTQAVNVYRYDIPARNFTLKSASQVEV